MDPVTALGAASAAVQLLDFVAKLLSTSIAIYKSKTDSVGAHEDLLTITQSLKTLNEDVISKAAPGEKLDDEEEIENHEADQTDAIQQLCVSCNEVAAELIGALNKLQKGSGRSWKSFLLALKTVWSDSEVNSLQ